MEPSYTQDLRNCPEKHPETPIDAILILVRLFSCLCLDIGRLVCTVSISFKKFSIFQMILFITRVLKRTTEMKGNFCCRISEFLEQTWFYLLVYIFRMMVLGTRSKK